MQYSIVYNGTVIGPLTANQIMVYNVNQETKVSKNNGPWSPLYTFPELMSLLNEKRASFRHSSGQYSASGEDSKRVLCGIMAIILGTLGIQYFIIGKVGGGFLTILLSFVTCGLWGIITLIQGIMMLTMSDEQFYRKYVISKSVLPLF